MAKVIPTGEACRNLGFVMNMVLALFFLLADLYKERVVKVHSRTVK